MQRQWASWIVVTTVAASCLALLGLGEHRAALTLGFVSIVLSGLHRHHDWKAAARACFLVCLVLGSAGFSVEIAREIRDNFREPPEWDFLGFWLHARTAVLGLSFYDSASTREIAPDLLVSEQFDREILDTGFWYPPPSMFLFLPLGWFELGHALAFWYALQLALLAANVLLLWRIFFPGGRILELAACAALVFACHGTLSTLGHAQTTFMGLMALLLFWRTRHRFAGGFWACLAMLVKPFLGVVAVCLLLARRWRALSGLVAWTVVLSLASAAVFGAAVFLDFFLRRHAAPKPPWIFSETSNQSMLGYVLRVTESSCETAADCVTNPVFLALAFGLAAATILLGRAVVRAREDWTVSLLLLAALLLYPVSQSFYSLFLIPLVLVVWRDRAELPGGAATAGLVGSSVYALGALSDGRTTVLATALLWSTMAWLAMRQVSVQRNGR